MIEERAIVALGFSAIPSVNFGSTYFVGNPDTPSLLEVEPLICGFGDHTPDFFNVRGEYR